MLLEVTSSPSISALPSSLWCTQAWIANVIAASHSSSRLLEDVLEGPVRVGAVLGFNDMRFGDYVVTLTEPGAPRMPNGVECRHALTPRTRVLAGRGRLRLGRFEVDPGPPWDPVPVFEPANVVRPGPEPPAAAGFLATSPERARAALLAGYMAGLVLLHGQRARADQVLKQALLETDPYASTSLRHAARGEVPEPVHRLLATGDARPLIEASPTGILWLRGLVSAGLLLRPAAAGAPVPMAARRPVTA
jgi:hypothetical protein